MVCWSGLWWGSQLVVLWGLSSVLVIERQGWLASLEVIERQGWLASLEVIERQGWLASLEVE